MAASALDDQRYGRDFVEEPELRRGGGGNGGDVDTVAFDERVVDVGDETARVAEGVSVGS